ncbi:RTX calcium-binding nonapeptide repeat [Rhabdaerophilaceae bacterium]
MTTKFWSQERQVNATGAGTQNQPDIAVLSNGDYVVVYADLDPTPDVVRVQRYNPFGEPIGGEITVGTTTSLARASITALPNGAFAVAWMSAGASISLQKFNADGTPNGNVIPVATNGTSFISQAVGILGLADGTIAVAYTKSVGLEIDAILKIVAANGTVGSEIVVDAAVGSLQSSTYLASNGSNLVVTWLDEPANVGDVQARTFTLAGGSPGAEVTLNTNVAGYQLFSPITALPGGGYVTVWRSDSDGSLRGQLLSSGLAKQGGEFIVSLDQFELDHIAVAATQNGNFFVAYRGRDGVLYGQAMTALGTLDGPRIRIADNVSSENSVNLSALPDGRIAATWADQSGLDGSGNGVFTRILDPRNGVVDGTSVANTLYGHQADGDQIAGFGGNDTIFGLGGADVLDGGAGNDSIFGGGDHDLLYGYLGNDILFGDAGNDTAFGWDGADQIGGQDGNDFLIGERGNDTLWGDGGNDQIGGSDGADELYGFADNDTLWGDGGNDRLEGGAGADELYGFADNDTLDGQDGDDRLAGGTGNDTMFGGPGNDVINGEDNDDQLFGFTGNDTMFGGTGNDLIDGEDNDDLLFGFAGNDTLYGGAGADDLLGEGDDDFMWGFTGNDTLQGGPGNDTLGGEAGNDTFVYFAGFGNDQIIGFEPGGSEGDVVRLLGIAGLTNYSQVTSAMSIFGGNVVLNAGPGNSITFVGFNSTGVFAPNDFAFV